MVLRGICKAVDGIFSSLNRSNIHPPYQCGQRPGHDPAHFEPLRMSLRVLRDRIFWAYMIVEIGFILEKINCCQIGESWPMLPRALKRSIAQELQGYLQQ